MPFWPVGKESRMTPALFSVSYAGFWGQSSLLAPRVHRQGPRVGIPGGDADGQAAAPFPAGCARRSRPPRSRAIWIASGSLPGGRGVHRFCLRGGGRSSLFGNAGRLRRVAGPARPHPGGDIVRVFTAYEAAGLTPATVWSRVVTGLRECCDRAAEHGVTIAVQNHHDLAVHSDALLELLGDVDRPNCKLGFDAWSLWLRGEDLFEAARRMAPYTACTTNADYVRLPRFRYRAGVGQLRAGAGHGAGGALWRGLHRLCGVFCRPAAGRVRRRGHLRNVLSPARRRQPGQSRPLCRRDISSG